MRFNLYFMRFQIIFYANLMIIPLCTLRLETEYLKNVKFAIDNIIIFI